MMDYLYGEMTAAEKQEYESWLEQHPEERQEIESLRLSRHLLGDVEEVQPKPLVIDMPRPGLQRKWLYRIGSVAAGLLLLWLFNFQILADQGGVVLSFGQPQRLNPTEKAEEAGIAEEAWADFLAENRQLLKAQLMQMDSSWENRFTALQSEQNRQWRQVRNEQARQVQQVSSAFAEQQLPRLAGLMQQLQIAQQEELQLLLVEFWNTWQETRETDLERIDYKMTNLYQNVERNQQESEARVVNYIQNVAGR